MDTSPTPSITFTVGTLAREAGVNVETVRYYQRRGLLRQPNRPPSGVRRYGESDLARLRLIKRAQQLRFTLAEIVDLLVHVEDGNCPAAKILTQRKLQTIDSQLARLQRVRDALQTLTVDCCGECPHPCPLLHGLRHGDLDLHCPSLGVQ